VLRGHWQQGCEAYTAIASGVGLSHESFYSLEGMCSTAMRHLFEHDNGGWLQDVPLLDRLVTEKLKAEAETIAAEGSKWIAVPGGTTDRHLR
jgi:hypothetical protein